MKELCQILGVPDGKAKLEVSKHLDYAALVLTPEEGFLLSRIDAAASIDEVLQLSTFPREQTIRMLEKFARDKIINAAQRAQAAKGAPPGRRPKEDVPGMVLQFCLDIEDEFERLQKSDLTSRQVLKVRENATRTECKKAYLALTRRFHPDRLFRREAGSYAKWLEVVFRRYNQAFEEIEKPPAEKGETAKPFAGKKPFGAEAIINPMMDRVHRSRDLLKDARAAAAKDPVGAMNTLKLALTLDPQNPEIRKLLEEVETRANLRRAIKFFEEAQKFEDMLANEKAREAYEKAAAGDPKCAQFQRGAGEFIAYKMKEPGKAAPYAQRACELEPGLPDNHLLQGFILKAQGKWAEAILCFEKALNLDKSNLFAKNEIAQLRNQLAKTSVISDKKRPS